MSVSEDTHAEQCDASHGSECHYGESQAVQSCDPLLSVQLSLCCRGRIVAPRGKRTDVIATENTSWSEDEVRNEQLDDQ